MTYHEKDIDYLDNLPKTWTSRRYYGWEHRRDWHHSWRALHDSLHAVNPASLVGRSLRYITRRYLHRMPAVYRSIKDLLDVLRIDDGKDIIITRYHYSSYYLDDNDVVRCLPLDHWKRRYRSWKRRYLNLPFNQRMKEFYENRAKQRKKDRERRKQKRIEAETLIDWLFYQRKREAKALEKQKLIQHGFDPELSFRNHKQTTKHE